MLSIKLILAVCVVLAIAEAQYQQYRGYQPRNPYPQGYPQRYPPREQVYGGRPKYEKYEDRDDDRYDDRRVEKSERRRYGKDDGDEALDKVNAIRKYIDSVVGRKLKDRFPPIRRDFGIECFVMIHSCVDSFYYGLIFRRR